ncbi:porin (plasmid) [Burkholderia vietnamiensis]|uniref:Porin, Gram-negative type n=1 Tax=Burkholderia vietnamiensis (strain G4 / LMG 22486) TaxID=269482 RepID=A4JTE7_BURVG|nr:porin, Gram-negative type [Burkholderia vietnamiensis G4]MCB4350296.1 porin [Burkholderia vietnamiensis]
MQKIELQATKKMVAMAALALTAAVQARAEGSVTLYGVVDSGIAYIHNSSGHSSQWKMSSSNLSGNQWGLKGNEDLGGGLAALFQIESGFDSASGSLVSAGQLFNRQAYVGLSSSYGTLTLGRQYDPVTDTVQPLTSDIFSGWFATPGDVDNFDDSARFSNAVKWVSPSWGGTTAEAMYALGGVAGSTGSGQTWSAALAYQSGTVSAAAGYLHIDNGNATAGKRGVSTADSLFNSPVNAAYASARSINIGRIAANYVVGSLTMGAAYSYSEYSADAASSFSGSQKYHNGSAFVQYQASPAMTFIGSYNYTRALGDSSAKYHQINIGTDYLLSKRTDIYALAGYQHAMGDNGQGPAEASMGSFAIPAGRSTQEVVVMGLRHRF